MGEGDGGGDGLGVKWWGDGDDIGGDDCDGGMDEARDWEMMVQWYFC